MVNSSERKISPFILVFLFIFFEGMRVTLTPAFSEELTSKEFINLSNVQYAILYLPFSLMALVSAIFSGFLIRKRGLYSTFTYAVVFDLGSLYFFGMALISYFFKSYAFIFLCIALGLSGAGFGMILPVVNTFIATIFPKKTTTAILGIYLSLSLGSFILYFFTDFLKKHINVVILVMALMLIIFFFIFSFYHVLPKTLASIESPKSFQKLWTLIVSMVCVGALEGLFFNWSIPFASNVGANENNIYLSFLIFFTISQIIYSILLYWFSFNLFFVLIPSLLFFSLFFGLFFHAMTHWEVIFCLVGFFLSANLPFTIAYGKKMFGIAPLVWGFLMAAYEAGYGLSSYGLGRLATLNSKSFLILALIFASLIIVLNIITMMNQRKKGQCLN